ncbi:MAG: GFA family protein [Sphingorhabdus sp.]|uniref:GFA family protein n=1 Tax=Sphingorhabdus sp. TaxID=1902408 RepID=UPI0025D1FBF2|nr:GFA family protein [Sphingorhabdus sp.]MCO4090544.1 GFA family protein [Sphingorhabdus sp.]
MDAIAVIITGGWQCGAVRYRADTVLDSAHICHCRMCQKAVGNLFAALIGIPRDAFCWTRGTPSLFQSSDPVLRGFCGDCGTPLLYDYTASKHLNVTIGSLDNPAAFPPQVQFGKEARMPWFDDICRLPDEGTTEETMAEHVPAIKLSNHQHPDHDTDQWPPQN